MLIDSHCHLDKLDLAAREGGLEAAIADARAEGVSGFLCVGAEPDDLDAVLAIAEARADVWASAGIHPLAVTGAAQQREAVSARLDRVVAIGETGLDFFKPGDGGEIHADAQLESFAWHLEEGGRRGLPVIVPHALGARRDARLHARPR